MIGFLIANNWVHGMDYLFFGRVIDDTGNRHRMAKSW